MAVIVGIASIVTEISHRVTLHNMFGVVLHELLHTIPQRRDSLNVLVQAQHETVLLSVVCHVLESIVVDVAKQLDAWLNTPIPLVVQHQLLLEEESRFKAAHVPITNRVSVDDLPLGHILSDLCCLVLINVVWEGPVLLGNLSIMCCARNE